MELLTTREFNGVALDCYKADNENDGFWATCELIGQLLEYANPGISIGNIHNRNKERLDKFSRVNQIDLPLKKNRKLSVKRSNLLQVMKCRRKNHLSCIKDIGRLSK